MYIAGYLVLTLGGLLLLGVPAFAAECRYVDLEYPKAGTKVSERQPELRWKSLAGVVSYRLQLQTRAPEAGIEWNLDTQVQGMAYRVPRPITRSATAVKVLISADCPQLGQQDLEARGASFFVDVTALCPKLEDVGYDQSAGQVRWKNSPKHTATEIAIYHADDGKLLHRKELPGQSLPWKSPDRTVAYMRPSCSEADGQPSMLILSPALNP